MAVLSDADRVAVWSSFMSNNVQTTGAMTKADLRDAVNAIDTFLDVNAATINSAIPLPARTALNASQKAHLLSYVALKRWGG